MSFRSEVLKAVGEFILREQSDFFNGGKLRPIPVMEFIRQSGFSDNFVYEAIKGKTILIGSEKYEISFFFCQNNIAHPFEMKKWLRSKIQSEDPRSPLSDTDLVRLWNSESTTRIGASQMRRYRREFSILDKNERRHNPRLLPVLV